MHVDTQAEQCTIADQLKQSHPEQYTIVDTTSQSQPEEGTIANSLVPSQPGRLESINESKPTAQPSTDSIASLRREEGGDSFASFAQQEEKGSPQTRRSRVSFVVDSAA